MHVRGNAKNIKESLVVPRDADGNEGERKMARKEEGKTREKRSTDKRLSRLTGYKREDG